VFDTTTNRAVAPDAEDRPGAPVDPRRLLVALRRSGRALGAAAALGGIAGIGAAAALQSDYEARVVLQWERDKDAGDDEARALATVLEAVKLPENLERARARLGLPGTAEAVARRVSVLSSYDSNVVTLRATGPDRAAAEALAGAAADSFLEHRVEKARERFEDQARALAANVEHAREEVLLARHAYGELLAENGVTDLVAEMKAAVDQAARLRAESQLARADALAEGARADALGRVARSEQRTTVLQETEILPEARRLAEASTDLATLRAQLAPDHPRVRALEAQVGALRARAAGAPARAQGDRTIGRNPQWEAAQTGMQAATAQREAARTRVESLTAATAEAQETLTRLSRIEGEAAKRQTRAKAAEAHLAELTTRLAETRDAARMPPSGFRVLARVAAPDRPAGARQALAVLGGPLSALAVAALFVALRATRGLRACTAAEVCYWARAPVVATSTWPQQAEAGADLVADLALCLRHAEGTTALLGLGEEEALGVAGLAAQLDGGRVRALSPWLSAVELRRATREATRALVLVQAGRRDALALGALRARLGRATGLGLVLIGVEAALADLPDRAGDVDTFWRGGGPGPAA
jgi:uncharacterized protein involved in exopolysaccharide biosynthesis